MKRKVFRLISQGGLGDALLITPALKALKETHPGCKIILYCTHPHHKHVYANNPHADVVKPAAFWRSPLDFICYYLKWKKFYHTGYGDLIGYGNGRTPAKIMEAVRKTAKGLIAEMLDVTLKDDQVQFFLTPAEDDKARLFMAQYRQPVAIHITSNTTANQNWEVERWEELIESLPQFTFIQIGLSTETPIRGAVDMRGKLAFRDSVALLKYASAFVGVVSSMAHATNAFGTPGVVFHGPSSPVIWGHPNNVNLDKGLSCAPCVDVLMHIPCPFGKKCMQQIAVAEVKEALLRQAAKKAGLPVPGTVAA